MLLVLYCNGLTIFACIVLPLWLLDPAFSSDHLGISVFVLAAAAAATLVVAAVLAFAKHLPEPGHQF